MIVRDLEIEILELLLLFINHYYSGEEHVTDTEILNRLYHIADKC